MDAEEMKKLIDEYKAQGLSDEEILDASYKALEDGKLAKEDLEIIANVLGYEFTPDFAKDETPAPIDIPEEGIEGGDEDEVAEAIEDAKEVTPEEADEESSDEKEDVEEDSDEEEDKGDEEEPDEEEEKKEARKLFGLD